MCDNYQEEEEEIIISLWNIAAKFDDYVFSTDNLILFYTIYNVKI